MRHALYGVHRWRYRHRVMNTLADIAAAANALSEAEKQKLLLYLAASLRRECRKAPEPRRLSAQTMRNWIAEDEADFERLSQSS